MIKLIFTSQDSGALLEIEFMKCELAVKSLGEKKENYSKSVVEVRPYALHLGDVKKCFTFVYKDFCSPYSLLSLFSFSLTSYSTFHFFFLSLSASFLLSYLRFPFSLSLFLVAIVILLPSPSCPLPPLRIIEHLSTGRLEGESPTIAISLPFISETHTDHQKT